jgi:hypothetical protein
MPSWNSYPVLMPPHYRFIVPIIYIFGYMKATFKIGVLKVSKNKAIPLTGRGGVQGCEM